MPISVCVYVCVYIYICACIKCDFSEIIFLRTFLISGCAGVFKELCYNNSSIAIYCQYCLIESHICILSCVSK